VLITVITQCLHIGQSAGDKSLTKKLEQSMGWCCETVEEQQGWSEHVKAVGQSHVGLGVHNLVGGQILAIIVVGILVVTQILVAALTGVENPCWSFVVA
jgi:hypothetical protein